MFSDHVSALQRVPAALLRINTLVVSFLFVIGLLSFFAGPKAIAILETISPPCLFKNFTHLPCLFCGFTRSFIAISQGQLTASFNYHPLGLPVLLGVLSFFLLSLLNRQAALHVLYIASRKQAVFGIITILFTAWVWKLAHNTAFW